MQDLESSTNALEDQLKSTREKQERALIQWKDNQQLMDKINKVISETLYSLNSYNIASGDLAQVSDQLDQLKV